jgi:hypothetical protein
MTDYYTLFGGREKHDAIVRALNLYADPTTTLEHHFPYCDIGKWAIGNIMRCTDTVQDVSDDRYIRNINDDLTEFFHLAKLKHELRDLYNTLISAIVVIYPSADYPVSDHESSVPRRDRFYIDDTTHLPLTTEECEFIASIEFIEFLNRYGGVLMTFECYGSNTPFLVETILAVLNAERTDIVRAIQLYILVESLNTPQPSAFPCTESTLVAMSTHKFKKMLTSTPDWRQRLEEDGFQFLSSVLFDSLGLQLNAREAYLTLFRRVDVVRKVVNSSYRHPLMPGIKPSPTFTLSPASVQVDDGDRFTLSPNEVLKMTSPEFITYIAEHWPDYVAHPMYRHNLSQAMMALWSTFSSLTLP